MTADELAQVLAYIDEAIRAVPVTLAHDDLVHQLVFLRRYLLAVHGPF
jgi:hypothetical protein